MTAVLSIDQGTSGTKAAVVRSDPSTGALLAQAVVEETVRPNYLDGGGVGTRPRRTLGNRCLRPVTGPFRPPTRLSRPSPWPTRARRCSRGTGHRQATVTCLVWQDRRAESVCDARRDHAEEVASKTGLVLDPYFSAPKMRWLRRHVTTRGVVTTTDTWLVHRLCGAFVSDSSTASRSLLFDLDERAWIRDCSTCSASGMRSCRRWWPATTSSVSLASSAAHPCHRADR